MQPGTPCAARTVAVLIHLQRQSASSPPYNRRQYHPATAQESKGTG